jgi:hypothetical protein
MQVMRTLLTVTAVKANIYFLTKVIPLTWQTLTLPTLHHSPDITSLFYPQAISTASFDYWAKHLSAFAMWMSGSIVINSGLRWCENQIAIELRLRLTVSKSTKPTRPTD